MYCMFADTSKKRDERQLVSLKTAKQNSKTTRNPLVKDSAGLLARIVGLAKETQG